MRWMLLATLWISAAATTAASAEEPASFVGPRLAIGRSTVGSGSDKTENVVDHLLKAAEHLEAAGLGDEAARLRGDARERAIRDQVLSRKESELECLQEEVDRLRALTGQVPSVVIELVVLEVDRRKLGLKARDFDQLIGFPKAEPASPSAIPAEMKSSPTRWIADANPARLPLFRELREKGIIKVLAEPTLVTAARRRASFRTGGEILTPVNEASPRGEAEMRSVPFGTHVEVFAVVLPDQRIRLETLFELSTASAPDAPLTSDRPACRAVTTCRLNTHAEMQLGQTLTLGRLLQPRPTEVESTGGIAGRKALAQTTAQGSDTADFVETIVFITPRLAHPANLPRAMDVVPAAAGDSEALPEAIDPAVFAPIDWDVFGPAVPVLKRRTVRD